jgi:hypothetical protein
VTAVVHHDAIGRVSCAGRDGGDDENKQSKRVEHGECGLRCGLEVGQYDCVEEDGLEGEDEVAGHLRQAWPFSEGRVLLVGLLLFVHRL